MRYRIIPIITIGYIFGVLWELYKLQVALFFCSFLTIICVIAYIWQRNQEKRAMHYKRWIIKKIPYLLLFIGIIAFVLGSIYTRTEKQKYQEVFELEEQELTIQGLLISNKIEKEYKEVYTLQIEKIGKDTKLKGKKIFVNIKRQGNIRLQYGDRVIINGKITAPEKQRNEGGFEDTIYVRSKGYIGRMYLVPSNIKVIQKDTIHGIKKIANEITKKIEKGIFNLLPEKTRGLCLGILLGNKEQIPQEIMQDFQKSGLAHMLAVSGTHVNYIILGVTMLLNKAKCNNRISICLTIFVLVFFLYMTGFTPSIARACIMGILALGAKLVYKKYDFVTSLSISVLIVTIKNPFVMQDIGFLLSYGGVIGIICFYPILQTYFNKFKLKVSSLLYNNKRVKEQIAESGLILIKEQTKGKKILQNILENVKSIIGISISANIVLIPILMINFKTISFTFWISNVLAINIMGIVVALGFLFSILSMIIKPLIPILGALLNICLELLIGIAKYCAQIPFSKMYVVPPKKSIICLYYIVLFGFWAYICWKEKEPKRIIEEWCFIKIECQKKKWQTICKVYKNFISLICIVCIILFNILQLLPKNFTIHMIDVGQGDSTLVVTSTGKTILVDGGGSTDSNFDVGERILLPYLLNKGIKQIDYLVFSHFDADHCMGLLAVIKNIKVNHILITKQPEKNKEYLLIIEEAMHKNIPIKIVKKGDTINIENNVNLQILFPDTNFISQNKINNNSMVIKLVTNDISVLFTGDIEEIAEKQLLQDIDPSVLKSDVLKVAHHGSKSSSSKDFLRAVRPNIAIIGVGANNTFGHPSSKVIEELKNINCKVYRTDEMGEITITVKRNRNIKINTQIPQKNV